MSRIAITLVLTAFLHVVSTPSYSIAESSESARASILKAENHFQKSFLLAEAPQQEKQLLTAQGILLDALKQDSNSADLHAKFSQVTGRIALLRGNKEKIKLGQQIKSHADRALALNPNQPIAHAVLGVWNYELAELSGLERFFAKILYGAVPEGDMGKAIEHLTKATQLAPNEIFYRVALAKAMIAFDRDSDAKKELIAALALPIASAADPPLKLEAKDILEDL